MNDAEALNEALQQRGQTVACAESLTGGRLAARLTDVPGSSKSFVGGVVSYATEVKREVLGVTAERVVTAECAGQMAAGVRDLMHSDWALATTGVAGPDAQEGEPVGTVYVGVAGPDGVATHRLDLSGGRAEIQEQTCRLALDLLAQALS